MSDAYLQPYREAQKVHGGEFDVTLWASPASQRRRFAAMVEMVPMAGRRVLDAGCSRGDFAAYLIERDIGFTRFIGVDGLAEVVAFAEARGLARSRFVAGDFVRDVSLLATDSPEVVTISGSLNTMDLDMACRVLEGAWAACREALVFNFLSDRAGPKAPIQLDPARRLPTMTLLDWALTRTSRVQLRQDYFANGHDASIAMFKAQGLGA